MRGKIGERRGKWKKIRKKRNGGSKRMLVAKMFKLGKQISTSISYFKEK